MAGARYTDPQTSHDAAKSVTNITPVKRAILDILQTAMADEELVATVRAIYGTAFASESGIRTRRAELVRDGYVEDSKGRTKLDSGRQAILWVKA
jgi:hypothetical protein